MQEDLVIKLSDFGFTVNQAKVYLSIVQSGSISANNISKIAQLHRQDIYKILPKLEKMGLITKTIGKPFMIEAIHVKTALHHLVSTEREKAKERISGLEANLEELINALKEQPEGKEEARFTLLTTDETIKNRADLTFKNVKIEVDWVTNLELLLKPIMNYFHESLQTLVNNRAKTLLIIENLDDEDLVRQTIEKLGPNKGYFTAKLIGKTIFKHYQIIDHKEVWIATQQKTESGFPCILWTNDQNIVYVYEEYFKNTWNHSRAITIYPKCNHIKRELAATQ